MLCQLKRDADKRILDLNEFAVEFLIAWQHTKTYTDYLYADGVHDDFAAYCAMSI